MKPKLIICEGIPGSGKSTTARYLAIQMERNGLAPVLYHETTAEHPIIFLDAVPDAQAWMERYLQNWRTFLAESAHRDSIVIMESVLLQFPILALLNKDLDREKIKCLIHEAAELIGQFDVTLIYFYQQDADAAIYNMIKRRGGSAYLQQKFDEYADGNYSVNRGGNNVEIHLDFLREYAGLAAEAAKLMPFETSSIENSQMDWAGYQRQLLELFKLDDYPDPAPTEEEMRPYVGQYRNEQLNADLYIQLVEGELRIFGERRLRCRKTDIFYLDDMSIQVSFFKEKGNSAYLIVGEKDLFGNRHEEGTRFEKMA